MNMEIKECAPIIIPTLCRIEHLQRCVESLKKSRWAKYTRLFISIDFPPNKKYVEGYNKVKKYVMTQIDGFKEVIYYIQTRNLGAYENERFLINEVYKKYDTFIFTEDDNVFAPSAIEYFNKGLISYRDNNDIIVICAHSKKEYIDGSNNTFLLPAFSGYGFATWKHKEQIYQDKLTKEYFQNILRNKIQLKKINAKGLLYVRTLLSIVYEKEQAHIWKDNKIAGTDLAISLYMLCENKYALYPKCLLSRNFGYDGSGINCGNQRILYELKIDNRDNFILKENEYEIKEIEDCRKRNTRDKAYFFIYKIQELLFPIYSHLR